MINVLMSRSSFLVSESASLELKSILKTNMNVVVIGFSFFGELDKTKYELQYGLNSEYQTKLTELFSFYGIKKVSLLTYYNMEKAEMVKKIKDADVLYFPGGAPDLMYKRIIEKDILNELKEFKGIAIGSSAGAMIQLNTFHISPDNEYKVYSENKGLGYLNDFFIEVHFRRRKKQKSSMRKVRKKYLKPVYIIPDDGMIIVSNNKVKCINTAKEYYTSKGVKK